MDEPVGVLLTGVRPGQHARIDASARDPVGVAYSSWAEYEADGGGTVDPAAAVPVAGTYRAADGFGLLWSMEGGTGAAFADGLDPVHTELVASIDGERCAAVVVSRRRLGPGVLVVPVRQAGLVGTLFRPAGGPAAAVLVVGGTGGGVDWSEPMAALLASRGLVALALAYFGLDGLPPLMREIPLEYFGDALAWLLARDEVAGARAGVLGNSRGGELALLLGATFPQIGAVVAGSPSGVVWAGFDPLEDRPRAAWTWRGKPLAFATPEWVPGEYLTTPPVVLSRLFERTLRDAGPTVAAATIAVERTRGPLLLVSGEDDLMWPSRLMCDMVMRRLADCGRRAAGEHLVFRGAGHAVVRPPGLPAAGKTIVHPADGLIYALGGSREANAAASSTAWPRIVRFLREHLTSR